MHPAYKWSHIIVWFAETAVETKHWEKPGVQGFSYFINHLREKGTYRGSPASLCKSWFNLNDNTAITEGQNNVREHPRYYSNFTNPKNLYPSIDLDESNESQQDLKISQLIWKAVVCFGVIQNTKTIGN